MKLKKDTTEQSHPHQYTFSGHVWIYPSERASWHFITVPKKESVHITTTYQHKKKGWGSLRVDAHIGNSIWSTSIFPDSKTGTYLLPLKSNIRAKEGIISGDMITCTITIKM